MQKILNKPERQHDIIKLFWVFALLLFIAIGFAAHASTAKTDAVLLRAPNLYGKNFFTILINSPDPKEAPKNMRILSPTDSSGLQASASALFSKGQLEFLISKLNSDSAPGTLGRAKQIHMIDTSAHAHGFVNNMQVMWLDESIQFGTADHALYDQEKALLEGLKKAKKLTLYALPESISESNLSLPEALKLGAQKIQVQADLVETEQQFLKGKKIFYTRIPMAASDFEKIEDKQIDQLSNILRALKKDEWLHFHNEEGASNLSQAILIVDILKSAATTELSEILIRQNGAGIQLKLAPIIQSAKLEKIYAYAKEQAPQFKKSWTQWYRSQAQH